MEHALSFAQRALWTACYAYAPDLRPHSCVLYRLRGSLDVAALEAALGDVVQRHESLRTIFPQTLGRPCAVVLPASEVRLPLEDVEAADGEREREALRQAQALFGEQFRFWSQPPWRAGLYRLAPDLHVFAVVLHEIVCDAWSLDILLRELTEAYEARCSGREPRLPEPILQMREVAEDERARWDGSDAVDAGYWAPALNGAPLTFELPRGPGSGRQARAPLYHKAAPLPTDVAAAVTALAAEQRATPFMVYLAACFLGLHRLGGETDLVVMSPAANRSPRELRSPIGMLMRNLPLRARFDDAPTFVELLGRVRQAVVDGMRNAAVSPLPQELVLRAGGPRGLWSQAVQFRLRGSGPTFGRGFELHGVRVEPYAQHAPGGSLSLDVDPGHDAAVKAMCAPNAFDRSVSEELVESYVEILSRCLEAPEARVPARATQPAPDDVRWRGFRLTGRLRALELSLERHRGVARALAAWDARRGGVTAFVEPRAGAQLKPGELDLWVKRDVDSWVLPGRYVVVPELPARADGSRPRQVDGQTAGSELSERPEVRSARAENAQILGSIWSELLGRPPSHPDESFFVAGGTLSRGVELTARARAAGLPLTPRGLLTGPTLAELAQAGGETAARPRESKSVRRDASGRVVVSLPRR